MRFVFVRGILAFLFFVSILVFLANTLEEAILAFKCFWTLCIFFKKCINFFSRFLQQNVTNMRRCEPQLKFTVFLPQQYFLKFQQRIIVVFRCFCEGGGTKYQNIIGI